MKDIPRLFHFGRVSGGPEWDANQWPWELEKLAHIANPEAGGWQLLFV